LPHFLLLSNLGFNVTAKRVIARAGFVEKRYALIASALECGLCQ